MLIRKLGLVAAVLLSWWTAAGAITAGTTHARSGEHRHTAPVWLERAPLPMLASEQREGGTPDDPPQRPWLIAQPGQTGTLTERTWFATPIGAHKLARAPHGRWTRGPPHG